VRLTGQKADSLSDKNVFLLLNSIYSWSQFVKDNFDPHRKKKFREKNREFLIFVVRSTNTDKPDNFNR
jgi:hypothetical protein